MKKLVPTEGKVIINTRGRRIELPVEATDDILGLPVVKVLLKAGRVKIVEDSNSEESSNAKKSDPRKESSNSKKSTKK